MISKDIQAKRADYYPLLGQLMNELDLAGTINKIIGTVDPQTKIDTGTYVALFIHHILGDMNIKMYHMDEFFKDKAMPLLVPWNPKIDPSELSDDRAARVLDAIWNANPQNVFSSIVSSAMKVHSLMNDVIHVDTTSISFEGEYDSQSAPENAPKVVLGFSKDHRPDLKQLIFGVGTTADGVPIVAEITNGNESDMTLNGRWVKNLRSMMKKEHDESLLYIADSSLVTTDNLKLRKAANIHIISRLPGRFEIEAKLKSRAILANDWIQVGPLSDEKDVASYKVWETVDELDGELYRFVVVHSDHKETRKRKTLAKDITKELDRQGKKLLKLGKRRFACKEDAVEEMSKFFTSRGLLFHEVEWEIQERQESVKRPTRGRPRKDEVPTSRMSFYLVGRLKIKEDVVIEESSEGGLFVLITSLQDEAKYPARKILEMYKGQGNVERIFRFIKNPAWVGAFCIKKEERLAALGYVLLMAAVVYTLWERKVRRALAQDNVKPIEGLNRVKTRKPTSYALTSALSAILVLTRKQAKKTEIWLSTELTPNQIRIIELSGFDTSIYEGCW